MSFKVSRSGRSREVGGRGVVEKKLLLPSAVPRLTDSDGLLLDVSGCQRKNLTESMQVLDRVTGMELKMEVTLDFFALPPTQLTV